ncbi:hypothetical protein APY04_0776 [Hyphomicrobium sulfonivorans]|uniref:Uncharacterized protein n=1 Tax=Hyphomicrobium sulfonivorans TaxID=121290 RepID=A0A109BLH2_HYPSL|nr:hypothetical protein [Hyphomicrobium sulfonivorans]KWT70715.1 hypothetical protein APY04_0776 [Hyphomicrobium sulfonivorans]
MPEKRLIAKDLVVDGHGEYVYGDGWGFYGEPVIVGADELCDKNGYVKAMGEVCLLGAVGRSRGLDMTALDPHDSESVADALNIADAMAREIVFWNDEGGMSRRVPIPSTAELRAYIWLPETPERRWSRMRAWVVKQIDNADEVQS